MTTNPPPVAHDPYGYAGQAPQKSWFSRNWFWFVPVLVLAPVLCCCGVCGGFMWFGWGEFKSLPVYKYTFQTVQADPEVQSAMGTPIEQGLPTSVNSNLVNGVNYMDCTYTITGPNGDGLVIAEGTDTGGVWELIYLEVVTPAGNAIILVDVDAEPESEAEDEVEPEDSSEAEAQP